MIFDLHRLQLDDMDRAAVVLRASFDDLLPWLVGCGCRASHPNGALVQIVVDAEPAASTVHPPGIAGLTVHHDRMMARQAVRGTCEVEQANGYELSA